MTLPPDARARQLWLLYAIAVVSFLPAVGYYYVGEEAIFPLSSLEMWHRGDWTNQTIYGNHVLHPPLFNWLIILGAGAVGWEYMLGVARVITIAATCMTGLVIAALARTLSGNPALAALSALVTITLADVFFYRGWLAYVDPLFAFFITAAIAALWTACHQQRSGWLWMGIAALSLALLSKAPTAYVFYALAALILLVTDRGYRRFLLTPASWLAHACALALLFAWFHLASDAGGQGARALSDILAKLAPRELGQYLAKLVTYPAEAALRLAPVPFIALYYLWRERGGAGNEDRRLARTALWIAAINFLPYWLAPHSAIRYLLPVFPFVALAAAWAIWHAGAPAVSVTLRWLVAVVALKFVVMLGVFPYYQQHYRGENQLLAARDIMQRTAGHELYTANDAATGLSVTAYLDVMRLPRAPLTFPPEHWGNGFVMARAPDAKLGENWKQYRLGGSDLYLLCRGAACKASR